MRVVAILVCCFLSGVALAQQKSGVRLLAKVKDGSILLRWAPTNSETWLLANRNGYYIERYTFNRKNETQKKPERVLLTATPIKPKPLEQWRGDVKKNDYSAVAAQAIYGSSFQATLPQNGGFTEIVNRSKEREQRFSFALFAADHSFQTARLSALAFKDSTVKKDERYLYRVYVANRDSKIKLDTGIFYLGLKDTVGLAPPMNLTAQFADHIVLLKWPKSFVQQTYTSFILERSEAGGDFIKRNFSPYINTSSEAETEMFFQALDSLPKNGVEYQYRIRGITPFGEVGPESERVTGKGFEMLDAKASITDAREEKSQVQIQWRILGNPKAVTGYFVERANDVSKNFQPLNEKPLSRETTSYTDLKPQSSSYYRIKIIADNDQTSTSFPVLVQLVDSIPPAQPQGLKVKIDTLGLVQVIWSPNREPDLLGYKIYRSNFFKAEFSEINHSVVLANAYADSVNIKALNKKVFYKLAAFDKRMNRSTYSEVVEASLPDVVPPQPPTIKEIKQALKGIFIAWNPSASDDMREYQLERRTKDSLQWKAINVHILKESSSYLDESVANGVVYSYRLFSIDKSNLKSVESNVVACKAVFNDKPSPVKVFDVKADPESQSIILQWDYGTQKIKRFLIYRAQGAESLVLYKSVSENEKKFVDRNVKINTIYRYAVKAVSATSESELSDVSQIKF